jgi:hypothetical protein
MGAIRLAAILRKPDRLEGVVGFIVREAGDLNQRQ